MIDTSSHGNVIFDQLFCFVWKTSNDFVTHSDIICCYFQGYVCPGYLVTSTDISNQSIIEEAWTSHSLVAPDKYKIISVGLSQHTRFLHFKQVGIIFNFFNSIFSLKVTLLNVACVMFYCFMCHCTALDLPAKTK